ncbi:hypothetical protein AVEN_129132-1 [Araneus ventricosus]|uniref:Uncharacterized protein n=1 Tax=Araneus ventricosus TaxID=182803 RepID=A0A4Y2WCL7_ARAVE|nr:hypothetical protein AVEN_129132-1 [Araneus ventricosus]
MGKQLGEDKSQSEESQKKVLNCRPRSRRTPGSKPDSTKDPSCIRPVASSHWCGAEVWRGGVSLGVVLVIWPRFKMTRSVPKYLRFTSKTGQ